MSTDVLDGLEDVDFAVLNDLLDAGIGRKVHAHSRRPIPCQYNISVIHFISFNCGQQISRGGGGQKPGKRTFFNLEKFI